MIRLAIALALLSWPAMAQIQAPPDPKPGDVCIATSQHTIRCLPGPCEVTVTLRGKDDQHYVIEVDSDSYDADTKLAPHIDGGWQNIAELPYRVSVKNCPGIHVLLRKSPEQ